MIVDALIEAYEESGEIESIANAREKIVQRIKELESAKSSLDTVIKRNLDSSNRLAVNGTEYRLINIVQYEYDLPATVGIIKKYLAHLDKDDLLATFGRVDAKALAALIADLKPQLGPSRCADMFTEIKSTAARKETTQFRSSKI